MTGGMNGQWVQLVQRNARPPTVAQRMRRSIAVEHRCEVRAPEQVEHRQIGLAMAAVRRGVYQHRAVIRPQDVSAPQITVNTRGRIVVVEHPVRDSLARPLHVAPLPGVDGAGIDGRADVRQHPFLGVELTPASVLRTGHRAIADEDLPVESGWRTTESGIVDTRVVHPGQRRAQLARGRFGGSARLHLRQFYMCRVDLEHVDHRRSGVTEPPQSGGFGWEEVGVHVGA